MILDAFEGFDTSKYTIVIVDDIPVNTRLIEKMLSLTKFTIKTFNRPQEALDDIAMDKPTIVLLDVMMPGIDGMTFLKRLRSDPTNADIRVIMVSAVNEISEIMQANALGANDYITKPVNVARLNATVKAQLEAYEQSKR